MTQIKNRELLILLAHVNAKDPRCDGGLHNFHRDIKNRDSAFCMCV